MCFCLSLCVYLYLYITSIYQSVCTYTSIYLVERKHLIYCLNRTALIWLLATRVNALKQLLKVRDLAYIHDFIILFVMLLQHRLQCILTHSMYRV